MASKRFYAYYIKGNKIALAEQEAGGGVCSLSGYSNQTTCEAAGGTWTENAIGNNYGEWRSPVASVTDGLEIQYTYAPTYRINDADDTLAATAYDEEAGTGLLKITLASSSFTKGDYIVITGSPRWNGLHRVNTTTSSALSVILDTKYSGGAVTEDFTVAQDVSALVDETSELDLPRYQSLAIVYYLKAKLSEDMADLDRHEYYMRQFKRQLEKSKSALQKGPHRMSGFMNRL